VANAVAASFPMLPSSADVGGDSSVELTEEEQEQVDRLQRFGAELAKSRRSAIEARAASGVERRWIEDDDAYHGRDGLNARTDMVMTVAGEVRPSSRTSTPSRATTFVQLTRQKTNAASARLSDMLYPADDRNWSVSPTPVPELSRLLKEEGEQEFVDPQTGAPLPHPVEARNIQLKDLAVERMAQATEQSNAMQREIDDALVECQYNYEGRKVIADAARLGCGILKGPLIVNRTKKKWAKQQTADGKSMHMLEIVEQTRPASVRVDPWNFFPDPSCGEDIQTGSHTWEREYVAGRELRRLSRTEGYLSGQINECLREGPQHYTAAGAYKPESRGDGEYQSPTVFNDSRFEIWTYVGEVTREQLISTGTLEDDRDDAAPDSHLDLISAVVVLCNERVIKAMLNPLDTEDLPYDVFIWEKISSSPWGAGIPYLMRYAQRTVNAAWRAMLDNAAMSHGPQIVLRRQHIQPADGRWEITGRKLWYASEEVDEIKKAFEVYDIPCRQGDLKAIIEMAMAFADQETSLPQISQGEQGSAPETVGGMTILMNSANTVLRRLVKQYDDMVTKPHITRYYDWFMQYSEKEEIKGDFEVHARGSSALIVRDMQQQMLVQLLSMTDHPTFGVFVDPEKLFRKTLESGHVSASDVMRSKEEIAERLAKPPEAPPPVPVQVAQVRAQAAMEAVKIDTESEKVNQELRMQQARDMRSSKLHEMALERDLMILKFAHERGMQINEVKAMLAKTVIEQQSKRRDHDADRRLKQADSMARGPTSGNPRDIKQPPAVATR
jgi:hypothetical protein